MKNYIVINGVTYDLVKRQTETAVVGENGLVAGPKLSDIAAGETFKLGAHEMVVLEHSGDTTAAICKDLLLEEQRFGDNNNFDGSDVDELCGKFAEKIAGIVGEGNLVEHTVDLTSDDGLKDYGEIKRKVSLLTTDLYRRYVYILDKYKLDDWWWLATPWSTPTHDDSTFVKCVSPSGYVNDDFSCYDRSGVRPFCILKSDIFVSL